MASYGDKNPATGKLYTPMEIMRVNSGLDPSTGFAGGAAPMGATPTTPTTPSNVYPAQDISGLYAGLSSEGGLTTSTPYSGELVTQMLDAGTFPSGGISWGQAGAPTIQQLLAGEYPQVGQPTTTPTMPVFGEGAAAGIPTPTVTPAPPYEISPEMQEMMDLYGATLTDWVTSGGYGLEPEVQAQMIQLQTDTLKAREQENIRVMTNNMERRGITNSGYLQANTNQITSNTTVAIAGAIADVQIKSALMKMASFEKGMSAMNNFLGFMSEQSQLAYAPEFATWQAEQMATMQAWQGKMDIYKMELNQAYQTQNMVLQGEIQSQLNTEQNEFNLLLAEMEIEANQKIALYQGIGGIFGTILGWLFGK